VRERGRKASRRRAGVTGRRAVSVAACRVAGLVAGSVTGRPAGSVRGRRAGSAAVHRVTGLAAGLALLLTLAACGSSPPTASPASASPASPSASPAGAYLGCLLQHRGGGQGSARKACASLRPADLGAVLQTFESCMKQHGVTVPSLPAQGRRAALLRFVSELRTGSRADRSALASCNPSGITG
jgi:hypothetical protein